MHNLKILNVTLLQSYYVTKVCLFLAFTSEFGGILQKIAPNAMLKFGGSKYYS